MIGFHGKLTWLPPAGNRRCLDFDHSRWNRPGAERSARETACGPLGVFGVGFLGAVIGAGARAQRMTTLEMTNINLLIREHDWT